MRVTSPVITIDGPSGSGKSTLSKAIAKSLRWNLLDSGAIYRALALKAFYCCMNDKSEKALISLAIRLDVRFLLIDSILKVILENEDVSEKIRTQEIAEIASKIAVFPRVRKILLHYQHSFLKFPGLVAEGRDMGTIVFPNAPVKIFLDSSLEERAYRRMIQLNKREFNVTFDHILLKLKERDYRDFNRAISPLIPAKSALFLNSTSLTIEQVVEKALQYIKGKISSHILTFNHKN